MRRIGSVLVALVLGVLCAAPTPGDVGGCGSEATALDEGSFARERKFVDCTHCRECGITTGRCTRACDPAATAETRLPDTCEPLAHDGKVCLRALDVADCDAYRSYMADVSPSTPGECRFCRLEGDPAAPPPVFGGDAGTGDGGAP